MDATTKRSSPNEGGKTFSLVLTSTDPDHPKVVRVRLPQEGTFTIGRREGADLRIVDAAVSRTHCIITIADGKLAIEDAGSANGTRVDGRALTGRAAIRAGSVIDVGGYVCLIQPAREGDPTAARASRERSTPQIKSALANVVVHSPKLKDAYALIDVLAESDIPVLVLGETGTGKDVYADTVHRASRRAAHPFVRLNCAALPEHLLEAELFGYERGAFTGAVAAKAGLIESGDRGTVFLDEIGDLPLAAQAKLLHVLETGEVTRLGALRPKRVDVRFVCATNRDLDGAIRTGTFRADLFYRIDGVSVTLPPLRERSEDVLPLAEHFLGRSGASLSEGAREKLRAHGWPGNVRELRNVIERAALLARGGLIEGSHVVFSSKPAQPSPNAGVKEEMAALERKRILEVLERCGGNKTHAAKELGISRTTLLARLDEYGIRK